MLALELLPGTYATELAHSAARLDDPDSIAPESIGRTELVAQLFDSYHRLALAVAFRVVGNVPEAEEVVQDAFVALWRSAEDYRPERGAARAWLMTIVRNRAIDRLRRRRHTTLVGIDEAGDPGIMDADLERVDASMDVDQARWALTHLPADQRQALELAYFEGLSQSEIAERLGVPLGTVKGRVRLGLSRLRTLFRMGGDRCD